MGIFLSCASTTKGGRTLSSLDVNKEIQGVRKNICQIAKTQRMNLDPKLGENWAWVAVHNKRIDSAILKLEDLIQLKQTPDKWGILSAIKLIECVGQYQNKFFKHLSALNKRKITNFELNTILGKIMWVQKLAHSILPIYKMNGNKKVKLMHFFPKLSIRLTLSDALWALMDSDVPIESVLSVQNKIEFP